MSGFGRIPGKGCGCAICMQPLRDPAPLTAEQSQVLNDLYAEQRRDHRARNPLVPREALDGPMFEYPEGMPASARSLVEATALEYGVDVQAIFQTWPRPADADAARVAAITRLANERIDDLPRYRLHDLQLWFKVSRPRIFKYRQRSAEYVLRRKRG